MEQRNSSSVNSTVIANANMHRLFWSVLAALSFISMHYVHILYAIILGIILLASLFMTTIITNKIRILENSTVLTKKQLIVRGFIVPMFLVLYGVLTSIY